MKRIKRIWTHAQKPLARLWAWAKNPGKPSRREKRWGLLSKWANRKRKLARPGSIDRKTWAKRRDSYQKKHDFLERQNDPEPAPSSGVGIFDGKPVAAWFVPILTEARKQGWGGVLNSGYRSPEYSQQLCYQICGAPSCPGRCAGTSSNHTRLDSGAAVDVSDPDGFARTPAARNAGLFNALGAADPWHMSRSGR